MVGKASIWSALVSAVSAGTILWDGRFNDMTSSADLNKWSFSNPVGAYQYYIHGSGTVDKYVNLDSSYKNPADTSSKQGVKITIDETAKWNGQTMLRTELIPQTTAAINKGTVYYHFSVKTSADNVPITTNEHQIAFFESHFTELKYGGQAAGNLQWNVGGVSKWEVALVADEWHNFAYAIDFSAGSVSLLHSTGSSPLTKTAGPFTASTSSNGADWHLGVLRLPGNTDGPGAEDWFFSGVYVESGDVTTTVSGPGGSGGVAEPAPVSTAVAALPTPVAAASSTAVAAVSSIVSSTVVAVVETSVASSTAAIAVETPVASSTAAAVVETPVVSLPAAVAPSVVVSSAPVASSAAAATPVPVASSTAAAGPTASAGAGSGSGSSPVLPEEFTIKQFVAWLRAKQAAF